MVILEVFTKPIKVSYKSTLISKATFITLIFGMVSVVLPFIFAYKSKGFWMKTDEFYEQPNVKFKGEYVFEATTNKLTMPLVTCSTLLQYQQKFDHLDYCSSVQVFELDTNFDNKPEELNLKLHINLPPKVYFTSLEIVIPIDYTLKICPMQMQAAIIFQTFLPTAMSKYKVMGDAITRQTSPLLCHRNFLTLYNESAFGDIDSYYGRNISTTFKQLHVDFVPGPAENFVFELVAHFPEQRIYFKPHFWQILKWAWIQYLSIYIIVSWLVTKTKSYIFSRRLVLYYEENPFKKKQ